MNFRPHIFSGFVLMFFGLVTGLVIPLFENVRLGLSAHVGGIQCGMMLIATCYVVSYLRLDDVSRSLRTLTYGLWGTYFALLAAAIFGTSTLTPIAGTETGGSVMAEVFVSFLFSLSGVATLIALGLLLFEMRRYRATTAVTNDQVSRRGGNSR